MQTIFILSGQSGFVQLPVTSYAASVRVHRLERLVDAIENAIFDPFPATRPVNAGRSLAVH